MNTEEALMTMASDHIDELRAERNQLKADVIRLRIALNSIYENSTKLPGRDAVQALLDAGYLTAEDVK